MKTSFLEARVSAGNFILGLLVLLLSYEYFTSRYLSRFPDYRLSYLIGTVTVAYFVVLRFINYHKKRQLPIIPSAATSTLDLLAALGIVGFALQYGNYPVAFLLNVDPSLYSFAPSGSIPVYLLTAAFVIFIIPRAATQLVLPPIPQRAVAQDPLAIPQSTVRIRAGSLEELVAALEQKTIELKNGPAGVAADSKGANLVYRLTGIIDGLRSMMPGVEIEGPPSEQLPEVVTWLGSVVPQRKSRWSNLTVLGLEPIAPPEKESLTSVMNQNPWAAVLSQRAVRHRGSNQ